VDKAARRALESCYPELEATEVWLRAREPHRDVVAVLYRDRARRMVWRGTPPHKIFAVRQDLSTEELPVEVGSPYEILGIK